MYIASKKIEVYNSVFLLKITLIVCIFLVKPINLLRLLLKNFSEGSAFAKKTFREGTLST